MRAALVWFGQTEMEGKVNDKLQRWLTLGWAVLVMLLGVAYFASQALAHDVPADECGFYAEVAKLIVDAKNKGASVTEVVPGVMAAIADCTQKAGCPIKDGEDSKRIMDFVRQVYGIDNKEPIDSEAVAAKVFEECQAHAKLHDKAMTPDPSVPWNGTQIEG